MDDYMKIGRIINKSIRKFAREKGFALLLVLIAVITLFQIINKHYLSVNNIRNILIAASLSGTLAVGIGCMLIAGMPDLSAGAVGCMGGLLMALFLRSGMGWVPAMVLSLIYGAIAGAMNAFFINQFRMMPFIATLAMSSVWRGMGNIITDNQSIAISNVVFNNIGSTWVLGMPLPFVIMLCLYIIYGLILKYTKFGRSIYMVGGNRMAARLAGISIKKVMTILMINCSVIASLGGAILAGRMHSAHPSSVHGTQLTGIIASCLGGISFGGGAGGMLGGFIGLMLLNFFNNGLTIAGLSSYWQIVASGLLLILALTVDYINGRVRLRVLKVK